MIGIRPCSPKSHADLIPEWDRLAEQRHAQIASGEDLSFEYVVAPTTWRLLENTDLTVVLDIGSGTGDFTVRLARVAARVIAVEPSRASVAVARKVCESTQNIRFFERALEEAVNSIDERPITTAVAVMTLMTAPDLHQLAKALSVLLQTGGRFVATITHPWFWPKYWGYEQEPWFHYQVETFIEAPFVISKKRTEHRTTHVHRPLEQYIGIFENEGFRLDTLAEPIPAPEVQALYPRPWQFPRFLGLRWEKVR
jgi:SAM-dependent methyltransferase